VYFFRFFLNEFIASGESSLTEKIAFNISAKSIIIEVVFLNEV